MMPRWLKRLRLWLASPSGWWTVRAAKRLSSPPTAGLQLAEKLPTLPQENYAANVCAFHLRAAQPVIDALRQQIETRLSGPSQHASANQNRQELEAALLDSWRDRAQGLSSFLSRTAGAWDESLDARLVGRLISETLTQPTPTPEQLDRAIHLFREFRRQSSSRVPEAFPLIAEFAKRKDRRRVMQAAYVEYLSCRPPDEVDVNDDDRAVEAVVQSLCDAPPPSTTGQHQEALRLLGLVEATCRHVANGLCRYQWVPAQQLLLHFHAGDHEQARKALKRLEPFESQLPRDARRDYAAGMLYRAESNWGLARRCFKNMLWPASSAIPPATITLAKTFLIEADVRGVESELRGPSPAAAPKVIKWSFWLKRMDKLIAATAEVSLLEQQVPLALALRHRLHGPSRNLHWVAQLSGRVGLDLAAIPGIRGLSEEAGFTRDERATAMAEFAEPNGLALLYRGRRFLSLGQFSRLDRLSAGRFSMLPNEGGSQAPEGLLLRAEFLLRIGEVSLAEASLARVKALDHEAFDTAFELRIETALARGDGKTALALLDDPAAQLLSWLTRKRLRARAIAACGIWSDACDAYRELLQHEPCSPWVLTDAGWESLTAGQDDVAQACFQQVLSLQPDNHYAELGSRLAVSSKSTNWEQLKSIEPRADYLMRSGRQRLFRSGRHDLLDELSRRL